MLKVSAEIAQFLTRAGADALLVFRRISPADPMIDLRRVPDDDVSFGEFRGVGGFELPAGPLDFESLKSGLGLLPKMFEAHPLLTAASHWPPPSKSDRD